MVQGVFFSLDGVDGAGKSTQISLFADWLREQGHSLVICRDPGSTPLGESVRSLLLDRHDLAIGRRSEMLLYMAARAQLVDELIRPALARGQTVVSDRFLLANVAYQGHGGELNVGDTWEVGRIATDGLMPDRTFVLDLDAATALARLGRQRDRIESRGVEFLARVRRGFLAEAARQPERMIVVNAARPADEVQVDIRRSAAELLRSRTQPGTH